VQLHGNIIEVSIYGFEHEAAAAAILTNLDTKLENAGVESTHPMAGPIDVCWFTFQLTVSPKSVHLDLPERLLGRRTKDQYRETCNDPVRRLGAHKEWRGCGNNTPPKPSRKRPHS